MNSVIFLAFVSAVVLLLTEDAAADVCRRYFRFIVRDTGGYNATTCNSMCFSGLEFRTATSQLNPSFLNTTGPLNNIGYLMDQTHSTTYCDGWFVPGTANFEMTVDFGTAQCVNYILIWRWDTYNNCLMPRKWTIQSWDDGMEPLVAGSFDGVGIDLFSRTWESAYGGSGSQSSYMGFRLAERSPTTEPTRSPSIAPSSTPTVSPSAAPTTSPSQAPTQRTIAMVSTTVTSGGCGASVPVGQPFVKADGTCTPVGFNTAVRATCTNGVPSIQQYFNDPGTCTSSNNEPFPTACQNAAMPPPFNNVQMGFGLSCDNYLPADLLQVTSYMGSCSARSEPMVTFLNINTCITPPRLPVSGNFPSPGGSFRNTVFKSGERIILKSEMWFNTLDCSGKPDNTFTTNMVAGDGGAVVGCVEGDPHRLNSARGSGSGGRLLQSIATEYMLLGTPSNLTESSDGVVLGSKLNSLSLIAIFALFFAAGMI